MRFRAASTGEKEEGKKTGLPMRMPTLRRKQRPVTRGDSSEAPVPEKIPEDKEDATADKVGDLTFNKSDITPKPSRRKSLKDFFRNIHTHKDGRGSETRPPTRAATVHSRVVSLTRDDQI